MKILKNTKLINRNKKSKFSKRYTKFKNINGGKKNRVDDNVIEHPYKKAITTKINTYETDISNFKSLEYQTKQSIFIKIYDCMNNVKIYSTLLEILYNDYFEQPKLDSMDTLSKIQLFGKFMRRQNHPDFSFTTNIYPFNISNFRSWIEWYLSIRREINEVTRKVNITEEAKKQIDSIEVKQEKKNKLSAIEMYSNYNKNLIKKFIIYFRRMLAYELIDYEEDKTHDIKILKIYKDFSCSTHISSLMKNKDELLTLLEKDEKGEASSEEYVKSIINFYKILTKNIKDSSEFIWSTNSDANKIIKEILKIYKKIMSLVEMIEYESLNYTSSKGNYKLKKKYGSDKTIQMTLCYILDYFYIINRIFNEQYVIYIILNCPIIDFIIDIDYIEDNFENNDKGKGITISGMFNMFINQLRNFNDEGKGKQAERATDIDTYTYQYIPPQRNENNNSNQESKLLKNYLNTNSKIISLNNRNNNQKENNTCLIKNKDTADLTEQITPIINELKKYKSSEKTETKREPNGPQPQSETLETNGTNGTTMNESVV
jgi:hypothetical protein